jgi:hypothetical protein
MSAQVSPPYHGLTAEQFADLADDGLEGGDVLPGFRLPLADVFR